MDADLFAVLYDRYNTRVYQRCLSLSGDRQLAGDLMHDIFLKAFVGMPNFTRRCSFSTWLYTITYNYCLDYLRKQQRHRNQALDEAQLSPDTPEDRYEAELLELRAEALQAVLDALSPEDHALLLMRYQDDLSVREMAEIRDLGESAVKMRLLRARERALALYHQLYPDAS